MPAPKGSRNRALGDENYDKRIQVPVSESKLNKYRQYAKDQETTLPALIREYLDQKLKK